MLRVSGTPGQGTSPPRAAPEPKSPAVRRAQRQIRRSPPPQRGRPEPHVVGELPRTPKKPQHTFPVGSTHFTRPGASAVSRAAALRVREGGSVRALQSRRSRGREQRPGTNGTGAPGGQGCAGRGKRQEGSAPAFRQQLPLVGEPPGAGAAPRPLPRAQRPQRPAPRASGSRPGARLGVACLDSPGLPSQSPAHPRALPSASPG